jgi:hypothetical protein
MQAELKPSRVARDILQGMSPRGKVLTAVVRPRPKQPAVPAWMAHCWLAALSPALVSQVVALT